MTNDKVTIIGIAGGTGSGKTTVSYIKYVSFNSEFFYIL